VRLVGPNGEQVGIVRVEDALRLAAEADLDLVEVAPTARPPVCKLMDFGKFKYENDMKERAARKNQANTILKTIRLRLKIDPHDYATKRGQAEKFLGAGDKVKVMIMFRGREQSRPEMGYRLLQRIAADLDEYGYVESSPLQDGRNMVMVIGPTKKKADAKAEAKGKARSGTRRRDREDAAEGHADTETPVAETAVAETAVAETPVAETPVAAAPVAAAAVTPVRAPVAETPAPAPRAAAPAAPAARSPRAATPAAARPAAARPAARPAAARPAAARPAAAAPPEAAAATPPSPVPAPSPAPRGVPAPKPVPKPAAQRQPVDS
jgi:translation initiation factor IF-3